MHKLIVLLMALCIAIWGSVVYLFVEENNHIDSLPTRVVIPTATETATATATMTPTASATTIPTMTPSATSTPQPSPTPTLAERVRQVTVIMPGITYQPSVTPLPDHIIQLPAPPNPVGPLPNATFSATPYVGWYRFESDHPSMEYAQPWTPRLHRDASEGQYHRSEQIGDSIRFGFHGQGLQVRYVAAVNMGAFDISIDGELLDHIDAQSSTLTFRTTPLYSLDPGDHIVTIRNRSSHTALDAIHIFNGGAGTLITAPQSTAIPQQAVAQVALVEAPLQVDETPAAPRERRIRVLIAYDENGNRAIDAAEGVSGVSVRVIADGTNRALAHTFTDRHGYAEMEVVSADPVRVVVPYFSQVWDVGARTDQTIAFTLLLEPGTQPGLIP